MSNNYHLREYDKSNRNLTHASRISAVLESHENMIKESMRSMNRLMENMFDNTRILGGDAFHDFDRLHNREISQGFVKNGNRYTYEIPMDKKMASKINIAKKNGLITIKGKDERAVDESNNNEIFRSYSSSSIIRSVKFPENADIKSLKAQYKDGILIISALERRI